MIAWTPMIKLTTGPSALRKEGIAGVLTLGVYDLPSHQYTPDLHRRRASDLEISTTNDWELGQ